ncbi:hypothetical protein NQU47_18615, partial [Pseudoalteromonas distincta]|uniref:hypothetical protein n=1 Tax=Pseudoalteromonas distincta TaxID=77608 RepID=UPI0023426B6C
RVFLCLKFSVYIVAHNPKAVGSPFISSGSRNHLNKNETARLKRVFLCLKFDECGDLAYRLKIICTA